MEIRLGSRRLLRRSGWSEVKRYSEGWRICIRGKLPLLMSFVLIVASLFGVAVESRGNMIVKVGEYYLGQDLASARGLTELTPEEYALLRSFPGWFNMPGEKIFKVPKVTFNGHLWDLTIGALEGKIYILGLQDFGPDRAVADALVRKTLAFVRSKMGSPTEQTATPKCYVWDSSNGMVTLAERGLHGSWSVNFVLTGKHPSP
jgi:hypothetical protein